MKRAQLVASTFLGALVAAVTLPAAAPDVYADGYIADGTATLTHCGQYTNIVFDPTPKQVNTPHDCTKDPGGPFNACCNQVNCVNTDNDPMNCGGCGVIALTGCDHGQKHDPTLKQKVDKKTFCKEPVHHMGHTTIRGDPTETKYCGPAMIDEYQLGLVCKDIRTDPTNCGKCGHECRAYMGCANGRCVPMAPADDSGGGGGGGRHAHSGGGSGGGNHHCKGKNKTCEENGECCSGDCAYVPKLGTADRCQ
jgi:hypothetical protein